jgi:hypothetical protein
MGWDFVKNSAEGKNEPCPPVRDQRSAEWECFGLEGENATRRGGKLDAGW